MSDRPWYERPQWSNESVPLPDYIGPREIHPDEGPKDIYGLLRAMVDRIKWRDETEAEQMRVLVAKVEAENLLGELARSLTATRSEGEAKQEAETRHKAFDFPVNGPG